MNKRLLQSALVVGVLVGGLVSSRAQTVPTAPAVVTPLGNVMFGAGEEAEGFQVVGAEPSLSNHVVKGAPCSLEATIETAQTLSDGSRIVHQRTVHLYRDSKGRTRREETLAAIGPWAGAGTPPTMITIQDSKSGASYFLDPQRKTAGKTPTPPTGGGAIVTGGMIGGHAGDGPVTAEVRSATLVQHGVVAAGEGQGLFFREFKADQMVHLEEKSESLGKESVAGLPADRTRTTTTIPANAIGNERPLEIVRERWYSPDLQIVLRSTQADPRFGETTYEVTKIDRGEPAAALFEVPSDYKITEGDVPMWIHRDSKFK